MPQLTPADEAIIEENIQRQFTFLDRYLDVVRERKEEEKPSEVYNQWRGGLYARSLRSMQQRGILSGADPDDVIQWHLNPMADHCPDCIPIAAGSPYTLETLPTTPAAGDTQCLTNCQCYLTIQRKRMVA